MNSLFSFYINSKAQLLLLLIVSMSSQPVLVRLVNHTKEIFWKKKEFQTIEENMKILLGNKKLLFLFAFLFYLAAYKQKKNNNLLFGAFLKLKLKKWSKRYKYKPVRDKIIVKKSITLYLPQPPSFSKNPLPLWPPWHKYTHCFQVFFHPCWNEVQFCYHIMTSLALLFCFVYK